jgi:glyoxylase-like metal-dependent hydrolase (beta-lactamase superfamily II)
MARFGDQGAYEVGNVRICLAGDNLSEAHLGKLDGPRPDAVREKISAAQRGRAFTEEHKAKLRTAHYGKPLSEAHKAAQRAGHLRMKGTQPNA